MSVHLKAYMMVFAVFVGVICGDDVQPAVAMAASNKTAQVHENQAKQVVIRVNLNHPVLKLYRNGQLIEEFPVALGKQSTATPIGDFKVIDKQKNWGKGFGSRWIGLDVPWGTYGIHGTNRPESIGGYASHGCIRMKNADIERLYELVPLGSRVVITGNPLKHLRTLEHGNIGADVQLVQKALQQKSFYHGQLDGRFGSETQVALIYFQLNHHLPMDGQVTYDDYLALGLVKPR